MSASSFLSPRLAFAAASGVDHGRIQFYDGLFPQLQAGHYQLDITHELTAPDATKERYGLTRSVVVTGPEFTLPAGTVQAVYPPDTAAGDYTMTLPFIVLQDPTLPWERSLVPVAGPPSSVPWLALCLFSPDDVVAPAGAGASPVTTLKVADLVNPPANAGYVGPTLPAGWVPDDVLASTCTVVKVTQEAFGRVLPKITDLPFLAHTRAVNVAGEAGLMISCVLANRLPIVDVPTKFHACLVSLEGYDRLLANPAGLSGPAALACLYSWSFTALPEAHYSFETLVEGLIAEQASGGRFAMPVAAGATLPEDARVRIDAGYVPVASVVATGEETFAWYRGPFSPVQPQPLPLPGSGKTPVELTPDSDALLIYDKANGVFDASYAAAWQIGRATALGNGPYGQSLWALRRKALLAAVATGLHSTAPWWQDEVPPGAGGKVNMHGRFAALVGKGLAMHWTAAMQSGPQAPGVTAALARVTRHKPVTMHEVRALATAGLNQTHGLLAKRSVTIDVHLAGEIDPVAQFLKDLVVLAPIAFVQMVPLAAMLPTESVRFFHIDRDWIKAAIAGALSLAIQGSADQVIQTVLQPYLTASEADMPAAGMLIRSQLVSGWPTMVVTATSGGADAEVCHDVVLAQSVRLLLFRKVPDKVTLAEPYQGLTFGLSEEGVALRDLKTAVGKQLPQFLPASKSFADFKTQFTAPDGVLKVATLADALTKALAAAGGAPTGAFGGGDFAIQLVQAPDLQAFPSSKPRA